MTRQLDRREFLTSGSRAGAGMVLAGAALAQTDAPQPQPQSEGAPVRVGLVGYGKRGRSLISTLNALGPDVEILAVCDVLPERVAEAQAALERMGRPKPAGYAQGEEDFRRLCEQQDLDLVMNAAPWDWHVPICVAAMNAGKHTATEVPAAVTVDGCWQLVDTAEATGKHCVLLENCCYFRNAMMVLNMVRKGLLGEMLHAEAGYQHYRIANNVFDAEGNLLWCGEHESRRDGCLYPTHQVGPVGQWMNITRGDQFAYLVSMSSKSRGLNIYAARHFGPEHPLATRPYALGDINTTLIRTENGLTITLYHDTQAPRPYDLIYRAQGTNGLYMGTLDKIFIEGRSKSEEWDDIEPYLEEYEHPLWKALQQNALG
ncbi:MAG TPA: Gfo/Idh/MocA family oxidoreductase, partial [Candidatus Hydrogenedentes bacterium]|nr:Gfo/Idh/MocA family oxidoreductase [Candidatus Hydrogenedentota bacterium]